MALLLLINGLPGSGKSTLAQRYAAQHPMALCLDIDVVRELLGRWQDTPTDAGLLARRMALAMAHEALVDGHDVVVPQLLAKPEFIDRLEEAAHRAGAAFAEVLLHLEPDEALERLAARAAGPMSPAQRSAHLLLDRDGGPGTVVPTLYRRLTELSRRRPGTLSLAPVPGDVDATLRALRERLDARR